MRSLRCILAISLVLFLAGGTATAQVTYVKTNFTIGMTPLSGGTTLWTVGDDAIATVPIGFTFNFWGTNYTQVYVSTNGMFSFTSSTHSNAWATNETIGASPSAHGFAVAFWDDLYVANGASLVSYQTTGSAGNRTFTVEWLNVRHFFNAFSPSRPDATFQVVLHETSNVIEFHYDADVNNINHTNFGGSIGIEDQAGTTGIGGPNTGTGNRTQTTNYRFTPVASGNSTLTVISTHGNPSPPAGPTTYSNGTTVNCSVTSPWAGGTGIRYVCTGWTGTGDVTSGAGTSMSFVITQNSSITWVWVTEYDLTLTPIPSAGGTVGASPPGPWVPSGTSVTITATPNAGYQFVNWTGSITSATNPDTFTMSGPMNITGNFTLIQVTLTVTSAQGSPTPPVGPTTYNWGTSVTASVVSPVAGPTGTQYVCTGWTGTGDVPTPGATTSTTFTITQNSSITWNWVTEYDLTLTPSPAVGGTVGASPPGPWVQSGTSVTLNATPNAGYQFAGWTGDLTSSNNPETFTMSGPMNITGNFTPIQVTLTVVSAQGSPTPPVGPTVYTWGSSVTASVTTPVAGPAGTRYVCSGWTGTGDVPTPGTTTSTTFTITQDSSITWDWVTEYELILGVNPAGAGTVTATPPGPWFADGTSVSILAAPNAGYNFSGWSDDLSGTNNPEILVINAPSTV
ncbi:MAG: InlB B-repeat-containing protein, partial [Planctomycetota bacterium]